MLIDNTTSCFYYNVQSLFYKMKNIIKTYNYFGLKILWFELRGLKETRWCKNKEISTKVDDNEVFEFVLSCVWKLGWDDNWLWLKKIVFFLFWMFNVEIFLF